MAYCPDCGGRVGVDDTFCEQCGYNLKAEESSVQSYEFRYEPRSPEVFSKTTWLAYHSKKLIISGVILLIIGPVIGWAIWMYVPTFTLTVGANPSDGGSVSGSGNYHRNTYAEINTTPNQCFRFTGWTGAEIETPSFSVTDVYIGGSDVTVIANYYRFCIAPCAGHQYWEYFDTEPPYDYINLENSKSATDPTWAQLRTFIQADYTDRETYRVPDFMCGEYAEQVHNNAEEAGIKAAFVAVEFEGDPVGHAINAFDTSDRGLVFVDCTGGKAVVLWGGTITIHSDWDKIAYLEMGKYYGLISLSSIKGLTYDSYEEYRRDYQKYEDAVDAYNKLVSEYNSLYWSCIFSFEIDAECYQLDSMYDSLIAQEADLEREKSELGPLWATLGMVENISVYW